MRIPFWQRDQAHPTKAIDRLQHHRSSRQLIGLWTSEDFSTVTASLVHVKGTGKFARCSQKDFHIVQLEDAAQRVLIDLSKDESPRDADLQFAGTELAAYQADACLKLMARAGATASEVAAIGVLDPGIQTIDFEGSRLFRSLTSSVELAGKTSITVIDRFRERDIYDGGTGENLLALAYWFLLGDRNSKIAEEDRLLVKAKSESTLEAFFLPASDGLDASLPDVKIFETSNNQGAAAEVISRVNEFRSSDLRLRVIVQSEKGTGDFLTHELVLKEFDQFGFVQISTLDAAGFSQIESVACAFLANAFIDQLPVSIPDLTGNPNPKVLGSLTPGSLVNFRNFIQQASKVTPSVMKLRDAI